MNGNAFMIWLLTSPAHGLVSGNMTVLHVRGRKTDNLYHVPVNFVQVGDKIIVISSPTRTWWRNLEGGAALSLHLRGDNVSAYGTVLQNRADAADALADCIWERPALARTLRVDRDANGTPNPAALSRAVSERVVVQLQLGVAAYQPS
jgi:hypothetical protein